jgi:8-oxo-dGTP pyrophosphatase MutT (NUDIX family)
VPGQQHIPRPGSYRPGADAPWAGLAPDQRRFTLAEVRARLATLPPGAAPVPRVAGSVDAAVLVPLYEADGDVKVVLIKRPDTMPSHRGEIAFPGGKFEGAHDADLQVTALREAHEEIGLAPKDVEIVTRLTGIATVASRFTITPFVGLLEARPVLHPMEDMGVYFYELADETVWGATARILTSFLAHLTAAP